MHSLFAIGVCDEWPSVIASFNDDKPLDSLIQV